MNDEGRIYLDHAATTPVDPRVLEAMLPYLTTAWGNPSSIYYEAREARKGLDGARRAVAEALGVPMYSSESWRDHYVAFYAKIRSRVLRLLQPDEARAVESFWRSFLENAGYFHFRPVLIHRDLDDAHVLVDAERGRITGVIDFGDVCVGDPALDFAGFEGSFRAGMLSSYKLPLDETFEERATIYRQKISPFHAVLYGLEINDPDWVRRGVEAIRERIVKQGAT